MKFNLLQATALAVLLCAAMVAALTNDVFTNGRRLADHVIFNGRAIRQTPLLIPDTRNCFIDSGKTGSSLVGGGFLHRFQGVNYCCKQSGTMTKRGPKFGCRYIGDDGREVIDDNYITAFDKERDPCLAECYGFGGCDKCIAQRFLTCEEICQNRGYDGGRCGNPGSTDLNNCCDCVFYS